MTQARRPAGSIPGGPYAHAVRGAADLALPADAPRVPHHGSEVAPWELAFGPPGEINEYSTSIPPLIAEVPLATSPELAQVFRAALVEVGVLERTYTGQVAALEPFLLRTEAIASSRIEEELTTVDQLTRAQCGISAPKEPVNFSV